MSYSSIIKACNLKFTYVIGYLRYLSLATTSPPTRIEPFPCTVLITKHIIKTQLPFKNDLLTNEVKSLGGIPSPRPPPPPELVLVLN